MVPAEQSWSATCRSRLHHAVGAVRTHVEERSNDVVLGANQNELLRANPCCGKASLVRKVVGMVYVLPSLLKYCQVLLLEDIRRSVSFSWQSVYLRVTCYFNQASFRI